jgi:putative ABC transport system permease protein
MLRETLRRIWYWLSMHREQAKIDEEMRLHIALRAERLEARGMTRTQALAAARRRFGNQLQLRERSREMWISQWFDDLLRDLRIGARGLARNAGFTAVAVLTIALGLGANIAIFSVIHTLLLKPLPFRDSEQIVQISRVSRDGDRLQSVSGAKLLYIRDHVTVFQAVGGMDFISSGFTLTGGGEPERIPGSRVSAGIFETLGTAPLAGRVFTREEDKPGTEDVAVISEGLWRRRFGGASSVIGSRMTLNDRPYTVVGVMPHGFLSRGSSTEAEVYVPLRMTFDPTDNANSYLVLGRLRNGKGLGDALRDLTRVAQQMREEFREFAGDRTRFDAVAYRDFLTGDVKPALLVLSGAVGLVLLLACANVANLLLARAVRRRREVAIRTAIGASRWRLLRQLLTESVLLSLLGSAAGLILAGIGMHALLQTLPESIPWSGEITFDLPVVAFAFVLALLTGALFGLAPAWSGCRIPIFETLKAASGRSTSGTSARRFRDALVAAEIAISVVLMVGASLLIQSFRQLQSVSLGFNPSGILTMKMSLQKHTNTQSMMRFIDPLVQRLNAAPGVVAAGTVTSLPLENGPDWEYEAEGRVDLSLGAEFRAISPRYLEAMGIRLVRGRSFTERDNSASLPVVIVNETFAHRAFPEGSAVGRRVYLPKNSPSWLQEPPREIVGIVADVREERLRKLPRAAAYVPQAQVSDGFSRMMNRFLPLSLAVRTQGAPLQAAQNVKRIVLSVDPLQPVAEIRSMEGVVSRSTSRERFNLTLMVLFGFVSLALASIGTYGVVSYAVSQRTQELGVRIALGASSEDVLRLVMSEGLLVSMVGVAAGLAGAYSLGRYLAGMLFSVKPSDPTTFFVVALLMLAVAFLANLIPAIRATRVDPITALRFE